VDRFHLEGIVPPNITPFDDTGQVFERGLREHVEFLVPHVGGFYSCGTYGSGPLMSVLERKRVLEIVQDQVQGRVPVVGHIGAVSTADVVALAIHAEGAGAAAVGIVPPFYYRYGDDALFQHYAAVLEAVSLPVYAYDNPKASGHEISPGLLARLADAGVWGLKDSSFSIGGLMDKQRTLRGRNFDFVVGTEALLLPAFALGVRASVAGLANAFPELTDALYQAAIGSDPNRAHRLQIKVCDVRDAMHIGPTIPTVHAILEMRGLNVGQPRAPHQSLTAESRDEVRDRLIELGML
jgi:N-acetylneuraminate lyase/4-hydroxy-tetrahydrodipicolinate synthase